MSFYKKHINRLFQAAISYLNRFLYNLVLLQGELSVALFRYLYFHNINTLCIEKWIKLSKNTHISTVKNWVHFLCKNNWSDLDSCHNYLHSFVGEGSN